ncbi:hypothetical protein LIN78_03910 [Leeia sp. TBRC 13508]|uniref:Uncharacterized protein n=1 Tax=Leeia speluncae TaxID=2884804 RepID=A0ABS8D3W4_9NEIS|nr:hypothetical protein [Leeia speluncae]MCB6182698.1 hypothetical protein [Leeia speluncae]
MKVKVFEDGKSQRIVLLLRQGYSMDILDQQDQAIASTLQARDGFLLEEQLYQYGIDVGLAIPQLITNGYFICNQ